ncbi:MAG: hypothetical protein LKI24_10915 [Acidipropionibacterium sp.]|nr:hypothetical protein [Acidipropionibacterium sp.]
MLNLSVETWMRFLIWMALGLIIYFAYSKHHSRLEHPEQLTADIGHEVTKVMDHQYGTRKKPRSAGSGEGSGSSSGDAGAGPEH